jgi:hypothetical protein
VQYLPTQLLEDKSRFAMLAITVLLVQLIKFNVPKVLTTLIWDKQYVDLALKVFSAKILE